MNCSSCNSELYANARFCSKCGNPIITIESKAYKKPITKITIFFFVLVAYLVLINFINTESSYSTIIINDIVFALIILIFLFTSLKENLSSIRFKKLEIPLLVYILLGAPLYALIVFYTANFINSSVFNVYQSYYFELFLETNHPLLLTFISIGLFPAIFEEIAMRGVIFKSLQKVTSIKSTIIITSILFTFLHFSLISALWIFPLAIFFGYLRAVHRTIWYGVIAHFIYNSSIVLWEILLG